MTIGASKQLLPWWSPAGSGHRRTQLLLLRHNRHPSSTTRSSSSHLFRCNPRSSPTSCCKTSGLTRSPSISITSRQTLSSHSYSMKTTRSVPALVGKLREFSSESSTPWSSGTALRHWSMILPIIVRPIRALTPSTSKSVQSPTMSRSFFTKENTKRHSRTRCTLVLRTPCQRVTAKISSGLALRPRRVSWARETPPWLFWRWHTKLSLTGRFEPTQKEAYE